MKGKLPSIVMVFVALALVLSLVAVVAVAPKEASADPGTLKWSEITIPEDGATGDYALWNNSDVGPIAVSPDGDTLFAAVLGNATDTSQTTNLTYYLMRSTDGGYGWKNPITKIDGLANTTFDAAGDSSAIVDIVVSPDWANDDIVLVATTSNVYISDDRGVEFTSTATSGALGTITSLDVALDENGRLTMVAGSDTDVYLKTWVGGWVAQSVTYDVLDVAFSPLYAGDGQIVAVTTDSSALTMVRAKFFEEAWAATLDDAEILDETSVSDESVRACIGFPDDYDALLGPVFVGIQTQDVGTDPLAIGDVWRIDWSSIKSTATDLNVRGVTAGVTPTDTDIWSIAVSGNADEALILAGPKVPLATAEPVQLLVHYSTDGGASWTAAIRPPSGLNSPYLALGSTAYVGTSGTESAFGYSIAVGELSEGACWGETGLIDTILSVIKDVAASPGYDVDGMLYMVTGNASSLANSLWLTTADRITWDRALYYLLASPQLSFDMVALPEDFPTDLSVFVAKSGTTMILRSDLAGAFWLKTIVARAAITAMTVVDADTIYTGDASGNVWRTTNAGTRWYKPDESEITGTVTSIVVEPEGAILVGSSDNRVYICYDESEAYEFERVGPVTGPGATVTLVAFDADYAENNTIYAGNGSDQIHRFVIDESTVWDRISPDTATINLSGLVVMDDGTLYASDTTADAGVWRSVNPTELIEEGGPDFEQMLTDLPTGAVLELLRVVPGGSNILFAVNASNQLIAYTDTLTGKPSLTLPEEESTAGVILEAGDQYGMARVTLVWTKMTGALNYSYQVAYDDEFKSIVASDSIAGTVDDVVLNPGQTYYWRVRVGAVGSWAGAPLLSPWSETWSFTTTLGPGAARPVLENPAAGAEGVALQPVLEWSGLIDATKYELMVARDCDWTDLVVDKTGDTALGAVTTYAVPAGVLDYDTSYCWKVRALSETTVSPWSDTGSFTVMAEPGPAEAAPTPAWVWAVIAIGAILLIALVVLIMRTRRPV